MYKTGRGIDRLSLEMISSSTRGVGDPTVGTLIKSQLWKDAFNDDLMEVDVKVGALGEENLVSA